LSGTTATGTTVGPGTVAVDPNLIPLGSELRIPSYGRGRARDTGGAIRGHHIDVWMRSCTAARRWGVRRLNIVVA
jgi:3D (Asp-Asp-Asp) domain-containing protein